MEDGFYWARYKLTKILGEPEIVNVFTACVGLQLADRFGGDDCESVSAFDFGEDPKAIDMPEWCKE